ncbi:MAG TPA: FkbM family methyltransferase [Gemmatimonadaceae bacterium]|nr:FkbM family methyltransferase [Gemmatimonadaceae bacterium]
MKEKIRSLAKKAIRGATTPRIREIFARGAFASMTDAERDDLRTKWNIVSMEWSLRQLHRLGFRPRGIVDVGAYEGEWARMAHAAFPTAPILMIEAQQRMSPVLAAVTSDLGPLLSHHTGLLGATSGESHEFFEMETGSSVLAERSSVARVGSMMTTETLDEVVNRKLSSPADFVKLDVQGYELEVLKGGRHTLSVAEAIVMEVSLLPINDGAPLLADVTEFMAEHGFVGYDICGMWRRPLDLALWQIDVLFLKADSALRSRVTYD